MATEDTQKIKIEEELMDMDGSGCASSEPFALRVLGDSMEPEFKDGCVIIIDPDGVVRRVYRNVSPSNHAQEIKNDLEAFERNS